ncbi:hypothetical protein [Nocardiopsis sp. Huas11]|uniref:hypothetical protein n=1 Tax=Nocardiopsis sp. Huas11 TaxID=2183912 RepID=UPI001F30B5B2|nr:hypothetical protein [Nocardiopsis sp. Huas11]
MSGLPQVRVPPGSPPAPPALPRGWAVRFDPTEDRTTALLQVQFTEPDGSVPTTTVDELLIGRMREDFIHEGDARHAVVSGYCSSALAEGVLVDASLGRMTLVPAVMALFGKAAWWMPRWLDRVLPDVDIEGANLRTGDAPATAPPPPGTGRS